MLAERENREGLQQDIISRDRKGREYIGGEVVVNGIEPDDFDSKVPLTEDEQGRTIRGAKLREAPEQK